MKRIILIFVALLVFSLPLLSQTKTNLDLIYNLIDQSVLKAESIIKNKNITYSFLYKSPDSFSFLKSNVISSYVRNGISIKDSDFSADKLEHIIKNIRVDYSNPFKDGFFGDLLMERTIYLEADLVLSDRTEIKTYDLNVAHKDTIEVESINKIENPEISFTRAPMPELPILSNLLEPIIVVGTLIVTIILFFTVRSK